MQRSIVTILILLSVSFLSNCIYAANGQILLEPIRFLLLGNKTIGSSEVQDGVIVIDDVKVEDVDTVTIDAQDDTLLELSGALAATVQNNSLLFITGGADGRFPFGLAGKVIEVTPNGGTTTVKLERVSYADIFKETNFNFSCITLDSSNYIGVIAPTVVQNNYTLNVGNTVQLNMQLDLADLENQASTAFPTYPNPGKGNFVITASLGNLRISDKTKFSSTGGLEQLSLRMGGDINYDVTFTGNTGVKFGTFPTAWGEVEDEKAQLIGQGSKLNDLDSDDRVGKFPLAGLVYSIPCPPDTCPVTTTGGDFELTNAFGVIVWLYLSLNGEYGVDDGSSGDGEITFARLNSAKLNLGVRKSGGGLDVIRALSRNASSGDLLVAPEVDGSAGMEIHAGITTDLDFFMGGLRVANAGIDLAADSDMFIDALSGKVTYFTEGLNSPWYFLGNSTFAYTIGAGGVFDGAVAFGVNINTSWNRLDGDGSYEYEIQIPTDAEMVQPGWHDAWYTQSGNYPQCDIYHPSECNTEGECLAVELHWYDDTCMSSPPTVVSGGGRLWMDRNLGATRVATQADFDNILWNAGFNSEANGDLYQWGRDTDGHEKRVSGTTTTLSSSDTPGHGDFILSNNGQPIYNDWRYPKNNDLWQGVNGINNPCPTGFRLPTKWEWNTEIASWSTQNSAGAFASPLKLLPAWYRNRVGGAINGHNIGDYWSSDIYYHGGIYLKLDSNSASMLGAPRSYGFSVRCIKD